MEVIPKPWGYEEIHYIGRLVVKKLIVRPNQQLSLQYHERKEEVLSVISGQGSITLQEDQIRVGRKEDIVVVEAGRIHRISAGPFGLVLLEVSTPELDDVVRLEDDYGRVEKRRLEDAYYD